MIRETLAPLRLPGLRLLLLGRTISALGNAFAPIALAFAVLDLTGSAGALGLVVGVRTAVNVLFLLFGGALADRLPRHLLMVGASLAAAATQGAVAALVLTHTATVPTLVALSAVNGAVGALMMPASAAVLPQIVPPDLRQQANALNRLFLNGAAILGAPVGGIVVAGIGPGWGIAVDAVTFLAAALCYALLRLPAGPPPAVAEPPAGAEPVAGEPVAATPARSGIVAELRTGWTEFVSRTWLWVVVAGFCVVNACLSGAFMVLGPVVADATIGRRAWGLVLAAETAGMILGALLAMRVRMRRLLLFGTACTGFVLLPVLTLGIAPHLAVLCAATFVAGLGVEQFGIAWETTMQEHIPADKLARVYSYDMVGSFVAIPVGQVVAGPVAQVVGVRPTLIGAAVLIAVAVLGMLSSRDVRHLEHRVPERAPAPMEESRA
ncbi:MFS transporter [Krasilnikovia sp. MM14-A1004]|uniref:MFS transporter n=1 Tax=Krasilnikovia sp. MM14-A1004 TaxID=3373541 RepID=UPI00399CF145